MPPLYHFSLINSLTYIHQIIPKLRIFSSHGHHFLEYKDEKGTIPHNEWSEFAQEGVEIRLQRLY